MICHTTLVQLQALAALYYLAMQAVQILDDLGENIQHGVNLLALEARMPCLLHGQITRVAKRH